MLVGKGIDVTAQQDGIAQLAIGGNEDGQIGIGRWRGSGSQHFLRVK